MSRRHGVRSVAAFLVALAVTGSVAGASGVSHVHSMSSDEVRVLSVRSARTNVVAKLQFFVGTKPLVGASVTWQTSDGVASGGPKKTDAFGKVNFGAVTGSVTVNVSGCDSDTTGCPGPNIARRFQSVSISTEFTGALQKLTISPPPPVRSLSVKVQLPDGSPVRGARVIDYGVIPERLEILTWLACLQWADSLGDADRCGRFVETRIGPWWIPGAEGFQEAEGYADGLCGGDLGFIDSCQAQKSNGDGLATFYGFSFVTEPGRTVSVFYDDGEMRQSLKLSDLTIDPTANPALTVTMPYMPYVAVSTDELVVGEGDPASIAVTAKDDAGDPIVNKTLAIAGAAASSVSTMSMSDVRPQGGCTAVRSAKTNSSGKATFKLCPKAYGVYYVKAKGLVASRNIKVFVGQKVAAKTWHSAALIATQAGLTVPRGAKVMLKVVDRYKANCSVVSGSLWMIKAGGCRLSVTVTPKTGKATSKYVAYRVTS